MSLNNNQMLPARVRSMRQMRDVLDAEDIVLAEIERMMDEMYQRASLLHEELVNEQWLEDKLSALLHGAAYVEKKTGTLQVEINLNTREMSVEEEKKVNAFIDKWLPAHLAYSIVYERILEAKTFFSCIWQDDEVFTMREVKL